MRTRKLWTDKERKILKKMYPDHYTIDVAKAMGRTLSSICGEAANMGLSKSKTFRKMELAKQGELLKVVGVKYRIKKGNISHNKGIPMTPEVYAAAKKTMFKKGHRPHNTKYNGHERVDSKDGFVLIRIRKGKYVHKHRLIWEKHKGKIPRGMIVAFKDGNKQNMKLSNLKLITKKENMLRNSIMRYPGPLRSAMHTLSKLKKIINEK